MVRIFVLLALIGCKGGEGPGGPGPGGSGADTSTDPRLAVLSELGNSVILPRYRDFSTRAEAMASSHAIFCASPDEAGLTAARAAYDEAMTPWKQAEASAFGPHYTEPWRIGPAIDFWPARPDNLEEVLAASDPLDQAAVDAMGSASKGLPAIDWLLWADPGGLSAFTGENGPRRCAFLVALSNDVALQAGRMVEAWEPDGGDFLGQLTRPGEEPWVDGEPAFMDSRDALDEVVNRMIFAVENVRALKLGKPAGQSSGGVPQPDALESAWSGRSLQNARDSLQGVADQFEHLEPLLPPERKDALVSALGSAHAEAQAALDAVPEPLSEAILSDPAAVERAIAAVRDLQVVLQVDVAQALQVTIRFNDTDGD